ncbi:MAG: hypothetical protein K6T26_01530 [Alicyclobacillus sp.]|nr:hypothetical protein [Alicyclobacillus sp.]
MQKQRPKRQRQPSTAADRRSSSQQRSGVLAHGTRRPAVSYAIGGADVNAQPCFLPLLLLLGLWGGARAFRGGGLGGPSNRVDPPGPGGMTRPGSPTWGGLGWGAPGGFGGWGVPSPQAGQGMMGGPGGWAGPGFPGGPGGQGSPGGFGGWGWPLFF